MERKRLLDINGIPFEENLVFYAPLIQGDTTDHISGKSVVVDTKASLSWNSDEYEVIAAAKLNGRIVRHCRRYFLRRCDR